MIHSSCVGVLSGTMAEPLIPRMARRTGQARFMESDAEFSLDQALSR